MTPIKLAVLAATALAGATQTLTPDHAGGFAALNRASGARLLATELDAQILEGGGRSDFSLGETGHFPPVVVDRRVANDAARARRWTEPVPRRAASSPLPRRGRQALHRPART